MKLLVCILAVASVVMLYILIAQKRCLDKMSKTIDEVCDGNLNQRIRVNPPGKPLGLLSVGINRLIDKLQAVSTEKLYLEESRKRMISNFSHDLRTPLTSLLGYIELVENDKELPEGDKRKYIEIIKAKGKTVSLLLEEFFQLSRIDANDITLHTERINLCAIAEDTAVALYDDITSADMRLELRIPADGAYVMGDRVCLVRVMENLLSNAVKYGADGGIVGVDIHLDRESVITEVWDRGKGIPQADMPFVFDRLYTSEKSRNRKLKGCGLGLAIARKLIEKLGGSISVSSIPFKKTCFTFTLKKDIYNE